MRQFGICMGGCEAEFERLVVELAAKRAFFTYLEIGLGRCQTFAAVSAILKERKPGLWLAIGVDPKPLETGPGAIFFMESARFFEQFNGTVDFCLIDGCHSYECTQADIRAVAPHVTPGGVVLVHDYNVTAQGGDIQPHCGKPIECRRAVLELMPLAGWRLEGVICGEADLAILRKDG